MFYSPTALLLLLAFPLPPEIARFFRLATQPRARGGRSSGCFFVLRVNLRREHGASFHAAPDGLAQKRAGSGGSYSFLSDHLYHASCLDTTTITTTIIASQLRFSIRHHAAPPRSREREENIGGRPSRDRRGGTFLFGSKRSWDRSDTRVGWQIWNKELLFLFFLSSFTSLSFPLLLLLLCSRHNPEKFAVFALDTRERKYLNQSFPYASAGLDAEGTTAQQERRAGQFQRSTTTVHKRWWRLKLALGR